MTARPFTVVELVASVTKAVTELHPQLTVGVVSTIAAGAVLALVEQEAIELAPCESCGQPADLRVHDESTWCIRCSDSARRVGATA